MLGRCLQIEDRNWVDGDPEAAEMEGYRTVSRPKLIEPTNLSVETVLPAIILNRRRNLM